MLRTRVEFSNHSVQKHCHCLSARELLCVPLGLQRYLLTYLLTYVTLNAIHK